jgi:hypothetical protein
MQEKNASPARARRSTAPPRGGIGEIPAPPPRRRRRARRRRRRAASHARSRGRAASLIAAWGQRFFLAIANWRPYSEFSFWRGEKIFAAEERRSDSVAGDVR